MKKGGVTEMSMTIDEAIAGFETDNALLAGSNESATIERNELAIKALKLLKAANAFYLNEVQHGKV